MTYPHTVFFHVGRVIMGPNWSLPLTYPIFASLVSTCLKKQPTPLNVCTYHPQGAGDVPLTISSDSQQIEIANTFASGAGAEFDKRLIHVKTGLLGSRSARAFTTFSSSKTNPPVW